MIILQLTTECIWTFCNTNLVMFLRTCTTARINAYMIYASSTSTLQCEKTDTLVFEIYFCVSRANIKLAWCRAPFTTHGTKKVIADYMY